MIENHNLTKLEGNSFEDGIKGDFGLDIKNSVKIMNGYSSQVYKAELNNDSVYIRINKESRVFEVEQLAYKIFEEKRIPVPKIIDYKENPTSIKLPTIIMTSAEGVNLNNANLSVDEKNIIYNEVGKILNKINESKLEGYGPLIVEDGKLKGKFKTIKEFSEYQNGRIEKSIDFAIKSNALDKKYLDKVNKIYDEILNLDFGQASLIHRDMHHSHIFVKDGKVSGIIDLGSLMAADPRYDIANSLIFINPENEESFKNGYGDLARDIMVDKYIVAIAIKKILFHERVGSTSSVDPLVYRLNNSLSKIPEYE